MARWASACVTMAAVVAMTAAPLSAQEITGAGRTAMVMVEQDSYELPDGRRVTRTLDSGFLFADDPNNPIDRSSFECTGTYVVAATGRSGSGGGYCTGRDESNDIWTIWWRGDTTGGTWGFMHGTGKYDDIDGGGTWKSGVRDGRGKYISQWAGTWTMQG